jgi:hypothetical protein
LYQKSLNHIKHASFVGRIAVIVGALAFVVSSIGFAQVSAGNPKDFFKSLTGEWIGTCEQSTDGQQAENKYFHAKVSQINPDTYQSKFDYYRADLKTGAPIPIGESNIVTTIKPDGSVSNKITGKGVMYVDKKLKNQQHELQEVLKGNTSGALQGTGSGKLSVFGMPLGLGKNGKVKDATSLWTLNNGVLTINQNLIASFKALFITKKFNFQAKYTARRGTDVAKLMTKPTQVSMKP